MDNCPQIDAVDAKILKSLLINARTSFSEIAKECGMSTNAIRMRFKQLKKNGIVNGSMVQINPKKFGYNCVALLLIKAEANSENAVYEFVCKIPNVVSCFRPISRYNVQSLVASKNVDELSNIIEHIHSHPKVIVVKQAIWVDVIKMEHPENLLITPQNRKCHPIEVASEKLKLAKTISHFDEDKEALKKSHELDKTDISIIKILSENASLSFRKIGKKLGISTQSVINRYKQMRKTVLPFSAITVDLKKLGYLSLALFMVKTSHEHTKSNVHSKILKIPNVILAHKCVGAIDMYLVVPVKNYQELYNVKQKISCTPGVKELEVFMDQIFPSWPLNPFTKIIPKK